VAVVPASGSVLYYAEDLLGSSRVIVQSNGTLCYDADFTPFGGEKSYTSTCPQNYKFEGKERDIETGNDDFGARYYSWRFGRWLSSDWSAVPVAVPYANLNNPQTLNLYAMVADDPESFADLDGHVGGNTGTTSASCGNVAPGAFMCVTDEGGGRLGVTKEDREDASLASDARLATANNNAWDQAHNLQGVQEMMASAQQRFEEDRQSGKLGLFGDTSQGTLNINFDSLLKKTSDFSAGAGDCLTGRCIPFVHTSFTEWARGRADSVVDKNSLAYKGGEVTGAAVGTGIVSLGVANAAVGVESKIALHGAHHTFEWLGGARLAHLQIIMWVAGQKASDFVNWHIPLPWR